MTLQAMKKLMTRGGLLLTLCLAPMACHAWDYEGHRAVNLLALSSLPSDFPAFALTPAARERVAFLAGEPDRWRNTTDPTLKHFNGPDHYMDLEDMADYGIDVHAMPPFRYEFTAQLARARAAHPEKFPTIDPAKNEDHTRELVGFLPWAITENFDKLKSEFSYLKAFQEGGGTPEEISNAEQNIIYIMGVLGHYVGDGSQPLHTTKHHHGWVGENPKGYNTESRFHSWIDGGYFQKTGGIDLKQIQKFVHPAQLISLAYPEQKTGDTFSIVTLYMLDTYKLVEPLYELDKAGKLSGEGAAGLEGKTFLNGQLVKAGQMLGNLWFTAWQQAPADTFLKSQLARRKQAQSKASEQK
jgi:hypothetical protein